MSTSSTPILTVKAFGRLDIEVNGQSLPLPIKLTGDPPRFGRKIRALFALLAIDKKPKTRKQVFSAIWPDEPQKGRTGLSPLVGLARRAFGEAHFRYTLFKVGESELAINPQASIRFDLWVVRALLDAIYANDIQADQIFQHLTQLVELAHRPLLEDLPEFPFIKTERKLVLGELVRGFLHGAECLENLGRGAGLDEVLRVLIERSGAKVNRDSLLDGLLREARFEGRLRRLLPVGFAVEDTGAEVEPEEEAKVRGRAQGQRERQVQGNHSTVQTQFSQIQNTIRLFSCNAYGNPSSRIFLAWPKEPGSVRYEVLAVGVVEAAITVANHILKTRPANTLALIVKEQDEKQASEVILQACLKPITIQAWDNGAI